MSAEEFHKHKPKDIKPQGADSGFDADKVDGLHAAEIGGGGGEPHRKWSWADEQGWIKCIKLPLADDNNWKKYAGNPVLPHLTSGADSSVIHPCTVYRNNTYYLFYGGYNHALGMGTMQICVATAPNPEGPYTRNPNNPVIPRHAGQWDDCIQVPQIIYDDYEGKWKIWTTCYDSVGSSSVGYSTCAGDPLNPANWATLTRVNTTMHHQTVVRLGNIYFMYWENNGNIDLATSPDGITWTQYGQVLTKGSVGQWDSARLTHLSIFWNLGVFYICYSGANPDPKFDVGIALSGNGWQFNKWIRNPVLRRGSAGSWDDGQVASPSLLMMEDAFYLWYQGWDGSSPWQEIGVAKLPNW